MAIKLTKEQFIEKAKKIHGNKYDYSKVNYINNKIKVCIICSIHGEFWQTPNNHLKGKNCIQCSQNRKLTREEFIEKAKQVHGSRYDYSKVKFRILSDKICIICPKHGEFWQVASHHLNNKRNCRKCVGTKKLTTKEFIEKAKEVHGNRYDYSKVNYKNSNFKIIIICSKHGEFKIRPDAHYTNGCPKCSSSKGEKIIRNFLIEKNINFEEQKIFEKCKNKKYLPFDFYLPEYNLLIEYDGKHHFEPIYIFGGKNYLRTVKKHDELKNEFARKNKINLLRIPFWNKKLIKEEIDGQLFYR
jgi:very-short-patch-repair endonuclease